MKIIMFLRRYRGFAVMAIAAWFSSLILLIFSRHRISVLVFALLSLLFAFISWVLVEI